MQRNFFTLFIFLLFLLLQFAIHSSFGQSRVYDIELQTDVLIVGGGTSGVTAAIQAARDGVNVIVVEPTPWLGGMLTAAGVSAVDGNHHLPSGIWGEFRERLRDHYGGAEALATGWVSHTLFEPHIGNQIFNNMLEEYPNVQRLHGYTTDKAIVEEDRVYGATFIHKKGQTLKIEAAISIDATEYGDLMARSGANYFVGLDSKSLTHEEIAPTYGHSIIQDLTYTAILKDYGPDADMTLPRPPNYQPAIFRNACKELSENPAEFEGVDCETMLNYARLPNDKYLINWPNNGNDYYLNVLEMDHDERKILLEQAKNRTRQFIYFLQTQGGFKNLGLADDEFNTEDGFPYIPYHRESRRLYGLTMLTMNELMDPYGAGTDLYKTAVGVGDYPLDHHRKLNPSPPDSLLRDGDREPFEFETHYDAFPPIPSFSIPFGSLIPKKTDGLIVAEKSISVSSIANGSGRLQPVVMTIGQAAGVAASLCIKQEIQPRDLSVRNVQQHLLDFGGWLMPFVDTSPQDWFFQPLQRLGVSGVLKGEGIPNAWANQTKIYPDSTMTLFQIENALEVASGGQQLPLFDGNSNQLATQAEVIVAVWTLVGAPEPEGAVELSTENLTDTAIKAFHFAFEAGWTEPWMNRDQPDAGKPIRRKEFAWIADKVLNPFENLPVSIVPKAYKTKQ